MRGSIRGRWTHSESTGAGQYGISLGVASGQYVTAEQDGGGAVNADRSDIGAWEMFVLTDLNGGSLVSGDEVTISTGTGHYFHAANGGGSTLDATATTAGVTEHFRIQRLNGGRRNDQE